MEEKHKAIRSSEERLDMETPSVHQALDDMSPPATSLFEADIQQGKMWSVHRVLPVILVQWTTIPSALHEVNVELIEGNPSHRFSPATKCIEKPIANRRDNS